MSDPESIWLQNADDAKYSDEGRLWCQDKVWPNDQEESEPTKYIRADICEKQIVTIASMTAEIERLREDKDIILTNGREWRSRAEAAEAKLKQIDVICHTPTPSAEKAHRHFQRDFDAIRKLCRNLTESK